MGEEAPKPQIDLNELRDKIKAGKDTGHTPVDFANLTPQQLHDTHFVNPAAHPDYKPGPALEDIRRAIEEQRSQETPPATPTQP